jgi:hypothetical protein
MYLFICIVVLETNIVFVLGHILQFWLRSMKDQWNVNKFYSICKYHIHPKTSSFPVLMPSQTCPSASINSSKMIRPIGSNGASAGNTE